MPKMPDSIKMSGLPELHQQAIADMLPQLLIAMIKEHGGSYRIPVAKVDDTGQDMLQMRVDGKDFIFTSTKKS